MRPQKVIDSPSLRMINFFKDRYHLAIGLLFSVVVTITACTPEAERPERNSDAYRQAVSDFYVSLAAIQADNLLFAVEKMKAVTDLYPQEAAAWANLSVFAMRQGDFEMAEAHIDQALDRAPNNAQIIFLAGIIESRRGNINRSVDYLKEAASLDSSNPKIAFALAEELERQDEPENRSEVVNLLETILEQQPDNLAVLLELVRTSVKWENNDHLEQAMARFSELSSGWPAEVQRQFKETRQSLLEGGGSNPTFQLAFLSNSLNQLSTYQEDLAAVQIAPSQVGFLITDFNWLPEATTSVAAKDEQINFVYESLATESPNELAEPMSLSDRETSDWIRVGNGTAIVNDSLHMEFPGRVLSNNAVITLDYNYDFLNDLVFLGSGGMKIFQQQADSSFSEVTNSTGLPDRYLQKAYNGGWSRDLDMDGDLDLLVSPRGGLVEVLRNNGDGSFSPTDLFNVSGDLKNFHWADLDADMDADPVFLTKDGTLQIFSNERAGNFRQLEEVPEFSGLIDIEIADIDNNADFDLLVWHKEGITQINHR
jgi:tetratricopeptide (TPR) repeat protein